MPKYSLPNVRYLEIQSLFFHSFFPSCNEFRNPDGGEIQDTVHMYNKGNHRGCGSPEEMVKGLNGSSTKQDTQHSDQVRVAGWQRTNAMLEC